MSVARLVRLGGKFHGVLLRNSANIEAEWACWCAPRAVKLGVAVSVGPSESEEKEGGTCPAQARRELRPIRERAEATEGAKRGNQRGDPSDEGGLDLALGEDSGQPRALKEEFLERAGASAPEYGTRSWRSYRGESRLRGDNCVDCCCCPQFTRVRRLLRSKRQIQEQAMT